MPGEVVVISLSVNKDLCLKGGMTIKITGCYIPGSYAQLLTGHLSIPKAISQTNYGKGEKLGASWIR
jgi:hypothetical protein